MSFPSGFGTILTATLRSIPQGEVYPAKLVHHHCLGLEVLEIHPERGGVEQYAPVQPHAWSTALKRRGPRSYMHLPTTARMAAVSHSSNSLEITLFSIR